MTIYFTFLLKSFLHIFLFFASSSICISNGQRNYEHITIILRNHINEIAKHLCLSIGLHIWLLCFYECFFFFLISVIWFQTHHTESFGVIINGVEIFDIFFALHSFSLGPCVFFFVSLIRSKSKINTTYFFFFCVCSQFLSSYFHNINGFDMHLYRYVCASHFIQY